MGRYASSTTVSVEKSQGELKRLLSRYGADGFMLAETRTKAGIQFVIDRRCVKFQLELPDREDFLHTPDRGLERSAATVRKLWEQACRQKWRALLLFVKATLEAVDEGVVDFDQAFMPFTVVDQSGQTFHDRYGGEFRKWLESGKAPAALALP